MKKWIITFAMITAIVLSGCGTNQKSYRFFEPKTYSELKDHVAYMEDDLLITCEFNKTIKYDTSYVVIGYTLNEEDTWDRFVSVDCIHPRKAINEIVEKHFNG